MNEHEIEVARALVASPNFAWQPAMRDTLGRRVLAVADLDAIRSALMGRTDRRKRAHGGA